jgi:hypothetical protein
VTSALGVVGGASRRLPRVKGWIQPNTSSAARFRSARRFGDRPRRVRAGNEQAA